MHFSRTGIIVLTAGTVVAPALLGNQLAGTWAAPPANTAFE